MEPAGELMKATFPGTEPRLVSLDLQQIDIPRIQAIPGHGDM